MRAAKTLMTLSAVALIGLTACSSDDNSGDQIEVVIATTNFSETKILANMYEQVLEATGIQASIKELTTREVIFPALSSGDVQVTPEYLGTLTEYLNKQINGTDAEQLASGDADATLAAAQPLANEKNVTLLTPAAAQDQNAFAVTAQFAEANNLTSLSDLAAYSKDNPITLGGPPECPERPFCQPGLEETYGINIGSFSPLDAGGPLTIQALTQGTVDVGLVFSSSGSVAANDLVLLTDDKQLQTADNVVPAVHTPTLTDDLEAALNGVSDVLTTEDLQALNLQVDVDRKDPQDVAIAYLKDKGLIS